MKKTIYLHIGHPKTASSSLQYFLAKNHAVLEKQDYIYPLFARMVNHHSLFLWNVHETIALSWNNGSEILEKINLLNELLCQQLPLFKQKNIILSHESLIYNADKLIERLLPDFHIVVIAYFRRMDHYVESFYSELVSNGSECQPIDLHLRHKLNSVYMSRYAMLDQLEKQIGKENIIIRPFERAQLKNQNILEDFLSQIGIDDVTAFDMQQEDLNTALSTAAVQFIQKLNYAFAERNYFSMTKKVASNLKSLARRIGGKKLGSLLSYEQQMMLIEKTKDLDACIAREYLHRKDGRLFYESLPNASIKAEKDVLSADEIAELMAEFMLEHPPELVDPAIAGIERCHEELIAKARALEEKTVLIEKERL